MSNASRLIRRIGGRLLTMEETGRTQSAVMTELVNAVIDNDPGAAMMMDLATEAAKSVHRVLRAAPDVAHYLIR